MSIRARNALGLFLISAVALALEVLLTKILAYTVHTMLLYVVLGLALVGFGAAGSLVAVRPRWMSAERFPEVIAWAATLFPLAIVVAYAVFVRIAPSLFSFSAATVAAATVLTVPFLACGVVVALALSSEGRTAGRLYAANLLGSGVGSLLPLLLLGPLGGSRLLGVLALSAAAAAWPYVRAATGTLLRRTWMGVALLAVISAAWPTAVFPIQPEPMGQAEIIRRHAAENGIEVIKRFDEWDPTGRIEVFEYRDVPGGPVPYPFLFYAQDATSGSLLVRWDGPSRRGRGDVVSRMCTETVFAQGFSRARERVLVIGVGGGPDVQCALYHGARHVDAVEINGAAVQAVTGPFDELLGGIGSHPTVRYHVEDGRSFIHRAAHETYDLIQLSGVDTKHQFVSGALALSENHLYTKEAFSEFLTRLRPHGVVAMLRFGEWELLRAVNTAVAALRDLDIRAPQRHVVVIQNGVLYAALVGRDPFTAADVAGIREMYAGATRPFEGISIFFYELFDFPLRVPPVVTYGSGASSAPQLAAYFDGVANGDTSGFEDGYPLDISATVDDRPFYFDMTRYDRAEGWGRPHVKSLGTLLGTVLVLAVIAIVLPVRAIRRGISRRTSALAVGVFGGLGLAYLFVEVWLIHAFTLFLGHRTYAMGLILAVLLVATGAGALLGERSIPAAGSRLRIGAILAVVLLVLGAVGLPGLLEGLLGLPSALRAVVTAAYVAAVGLALGLPFPAALRWIAGESPAALPWCIGINAFASVLATLLVMPLALGFGYGRVLWTAVALYAAVLACSSAISSEPERRRASG